MATPYLMGYVLHLVIETAHHHSGLAGFAPEQVFTGRHRAIAKIRQHAFDEAFKAYPERFTRRRPDVAMPPASVSINPVQPDDDDPAPYSVVNFPHAASGEPHCRKIDVNF